MRVPSEGNEMLQASIENLREISEDFCDYMGLFIHGLEEYRNQEYTDNPELLGFAYPNLDDDISELIDMASIGVEGDQDKRILLTHKLSVLRHSLRDDSFLENALKPVFAHFDVDDLKVEDVAHADRYWVANLSLNDKEMHKFYTQCGFVADLEGGKGRHIKFRDAEGTTWGMYAPGSNKVWLKNEIKKTFSKGFRYTNNCNCLQKYGNRL
jgi:hypothetical protein